MRRGWESWDCSPWRRFRWDLINVYKYLMGRNEEEGDRLFSVVLRDRIRGNEHKLKHTNPM